MFDDASIKRFVKNNIRKERVSYEPRYQRIEPPTPSPKWVKNITSSGLVRVSGVNDPTKISIREWNKVIDVIESLEERVKALEGLNNITNK